MYVWSKALAVALVVTLWGYGATALQAKNHKDKDNSCQKPEGCPAPQLTTPTVESNCCPMEQMRTHCEAPVQNGCNPVDQEAINKAQKEALSKQHDAIKAQEKRQKAIAKAQHELEEKTAKEQARIDKANDKFNHENAEFKEANARYEAFYGGPSEAAAQVTPPPEPMPTPSAEITPPQQPETIVAVVEPTPAPAPTPAPVQETPKELPRTAGEMNLVGLFGLMSLSGSYLSRFFRR